MQRLSLSDFDLGNLKACKDEYQDIDTRAFLRYSARYWADDLRESGGKCIDRLATMAVAYCNPHVPTFWAWFAIYQRVHTALLPGNFTSLLLPSYFGLNEVVEGLPEESIFMNVNMRDSKHARLSLSWACRNGFSRQAPISIQRITFGKHRFIISPKKAKRLFCSGCSGLAVILIQRIAAVEYRSTVPP